MDKMLCVMTDCSKNGVIKPDAVKEFASIIKKMGYNALMLYTEDTYEIESQPYFGHLRGRYSKEELKDMDAFCRGIGIELIPSIQTLAHLQRIFNWQFTYRDVNDRDDILLVGEEKTYELIEEMIKTLAECFTSRKINIGLDEAYDLGSGEYFRRNGTRERFDILNEHLHRVCGILRKYSFEPMASSDMFCKLAAGLGGRVDQYGEVDTAKILEKAALPEDFSLLYWDYIHTEPEEYLQMIKRNKLFNRKVYFCGGAWTWRGFAPDNTCSIERTDAAVTACEAENIDGYIFSTWEDGGAECMHTAVLPALLFAAEKVHGNNNMDAIKAKFKEITGMNFDDFLLLDTFDTPGGKHAKSSSKYLLYNDPFMGIRDYRCSVADNEYYAELAKKIDAVETTEEYALLFRFYKKLAELLSVKAALGIKTRVAYLERDMEKLRAIIEEYALAIEKVKEFHDAFQNLWFSERKSHGFEIQDARLGGVMMRLSACKGRLEKLVNGEISEIPELDEPVLEQDTGIHHGWSSCISVNVNHVDIALD